MLLLERAAPGERTVDRNLAELLEVRSAGVDAGRLEPEELLEVAFVPRVLVGHERMHGADPARAERLVGVLLRGRAARHRHADIVGELLEELVEREPA